MQIAGTHPANHRAHAPAGVAVAARLRAVGLGAHNDWMLGRAGQAAYLLGSLPAFQHGNCLGGRGLALQREREQRGVAVDHRHARHLRADSDLRVLHAPALDLTQQLQWLGFDLVFLAAIADVWNNVVENVERGDAGVARARDGLQRGGVQGGDAKGVVQRFERHHNADRGAVRVGDQAAPPAALGALPLQHRKMLRVDLGDDQRHILGHAVGRGIRADCHTLGPQRLDCLGGIGGQSRKRQRHVGNLLAGLNDHLGDLGGRRVVEHPAHQFAVGPANRAIRAGERGDFEPGVAGQQLNHALAHGARCAEDGDWDFTIRHCGSFLYKRLSIISSS